MTPMTSLIPMPVPAAHLELLNLIGYQHLQNGRPQRALRIFEAMQALAPDNVQYGLAAACASLRCGQAEEALKTLDGLATSQTHEALAWLLRGQALTQLGRMAEAARAMRLFIRRRAQEDI